MENSNNSYLKVIEKLKDCNLTVATAESFTGGLLSSMFVNNSGASKYFKGGIVAYSNEIKINVLNVPEEIILKHTEVSRACCKAMVDSIIDIYNVDIGIATTGIAGDDNGNSGDIFYAIKYGSITFLEKMTFIKELPRNEVRKLSISVIFDSLLDLMKDW